MGESENGVNTGSEFGMQAVQRFRQLLIGRKAHPFGASVHLNKSMVTRILRGSLPDPEYLIPLLRIERVALSWLLTGQGTPYTVHAYATDAEAWQDIRAKLADEPGAWEICIATCPVGWTVILHQPCISTTKTGEEYTYRATDVVAGRVCGLLVARGLDRWGKVKPMQGMNLPTEAWMRLATGRLGNAELWGADGVPRLGHPVNIDSVSSWISNWPAQADSGLSQPDCASKALSPPLSEEEESLLIAFRSLTADERGVVVRMLSGLSAA